VTGILHYSDEMKMWGIHEIYDPGTRFNEGVNIYLIKETTKAFTFEEGKSVKVSGSCYLAETSFPVPEGATVYSIIITDLTEITEPDMIIENREGILRYSKDAKMWSIRYGYPGTIDSEDIYLIKETDEDFRFEEGKKVIVSGSCFPAEKGLVIVPAGTMVYYIVTTNLKYERTL
ncbi:MAG: hypothetical protein LBF62_01595, partial [Tannerellaceae bacterium]|jgi:hypothetical protein|nr:hypothetical protein [Tannerellaceae bacterium]